MRSIVRSTIQLASLRESVRSDVAAHADDPRVIDDFVAALNEVVAAAVVDAGSSPSIDVRWSRRVDPRHELWAEVRNTSGTPKSLIDDGIPSRLLQAYAERVEFDERIGGSVITLRCRV